MNHAVSHEQFTMKVVDGGNAWGFVMINADGSIDRLDCEALTGQTYTDVEVAALNVKDVLPVFTPELMADIFAQLKGTEIKLEESMLLVKNAGSVAVDLGVRIIKNGSGYQLFTTVTHAAFSSNFRHSHSSRAHFQQILKQVPTGITILNGDNFVVEMANDAYLRIAQREEAKFVGRPLFDSMPEVRETVEPLLTSVLKTGIPYHGVQFPVPLERNGKIELAYFDFLYHPLKDSDGTISSIIVTVVDVTHYVQAQHALSESERQFRNVFFGSPIAMAIFRGEDMIIEMANGRMLKEMWGRTEEETIGKKLLAVFPELAEQAYPALLDEVFKTGVTISSKEAFALVNASDGMRKFYVDYEYAPLLGADGSVSGIMVTVNDVTEKVESRKQIEESELFNRSVLESSPDCVKVLNTAGVITFINLNGICILEGESKSQFLGKRWESMWEAHNQPIVEAAVAKAIEGETFEFTASSPTVKGTLKWWKVQVKPIQDGEQNVMSVLATSRDITEDKNKELALKESEQKFRLLADSMPQFVWTADAAGQLNYFDQSVYEYSGLTPQALQLEGWVNMVHPEDLEENIVAWQQAIATGQHFLFEHRLRKWDGSYRWHLSRAAPKRGDEGDIQMWVGTSTDIEDQKTFANKLERLVQERTKELAERNMELASMNKELESFAYISSHDLQEPLRKIQTFAHQILEREAERLTEYGQDKFRRMQNAAMRMQILIEDLLNYSRTTNTKRVFEDYDLNQLLNEVNEDLKEELAQNNAVIKTNGLCNANIIPFQFRQLLYNLLRNSLKFAAADRAPVIHIGSKQVAGKELSHEALDKAQRYCHITVSDNGVGFEQAYSQKIFEVFQKLHTRQEYPGTGIGLAIVKKIVDNHHGLIEAHGEPGHGATFNIYLPVSEF